MSIETGTGNVFQDLGFGNAEELSYKSKLVMVFSAALKEQGFTQAKAAEVCGTDQLTISKVLSGRLDLVPTDRLIQWLGKLGLTVTTSVDPQPSWSPGGK